MVGEDFFLAAQLLDRVPEILEIGWAIDIRRGFTGLGDNLREDGTAETILRTAEIDQEQHRFVARAGFGTRHRGAQLRGQRKADISDGREGRNDKRDRCGDALVLAVFLPSGAHAHGVLADRNRETEGGTQFEPDRFNGGVKIGAIARDRGRGHPVRAQINAAQITNLRRS